MSEEKLYLDPDNGIAESQDCRVEIKEDTVMFRQGRLVCTIPQEALDLYHRLLAERRVNEAIAVPGDMYHFIVHFERSLSDDGGCVSTKYPGQSLEQALTSQFIDELQSSAFDDGGMAGHFKVIGGPWFERK